MRSKWEILTARAAKLRAEAEAIERELAGLDATRCGLRCGGCGAVHATEGDFARHYLIPDERWLNLGRCPERDRVTP
jgi:hypothetical protein